MTLLSAFALRGVLDSDLAKYDNGVLCSGVTIPASRINDNYCDCEDGTDEPGTSACSNGRFICVSPADEHLQLFASRVDDGICDCCDGSDEVSGMCPDTCKRMLLIKQQEVHNKIEAITDGLAKKTEMLKFVKDRVDGRKDRITLLNKEIEIVDVELRSLKELQTRQRIVDEAETDRRDTVGDVSHVSEVSEYRGNPTEEAGTEPDSSFPYPDQYKPVSEEDIQEIEEDAFPYPEEYRFPEPDQIEKQHTDFDTNDPVLDQDVFDEDDYFDTSPSEDPFDDVFEDERVTLLERARNVLSKIWRTDPGHTQRKDKEALKKEIRDIETEIRSKREEIEQLELISGQDLGPMFMFEPLVGECFELKDSQYTYELCTFKDSVQNQGNSKTSLGKFASWEDDYTIMNYVDGQKCWNGPKRSTRVELRCGSLNKILSASEPSMCEYAMTFETPLACSDIDLELLLAKSEFLMGQPSDSKL